MTHCNATCLTCKAGKNCINGRYCEAIHKYVEYDTLPKCTHK